MVKFDRVMGEAVLVTVSNLSEREVESFVQDRVQKFLAEPCTALQLYEFLASVADVQCDRVELPDGRRIAIGYISAFVQAACDVKKHYSPPDPDEAVKVDVEAVAAKLRASARPAN